MEFRKIVQIDYLHKLILLLTIYINTFSVLFFIFYAIGCYFVFNSCFLDAACMLVCFVRFLKVQIQMPPWNKLESLHPPSSHYLKRPSETFIANSFSCKIIVTKERSVHAFSTRSSLYIFEMECAFRCV